MAIEDVPTGFPRLANVEDVADRKTAVGLSIDISPKVLTFFEIEDSAFYNDDNVEGSTPTTADVVADPQEMILVIVFRSL